MKHLFTYAALLMSLSAFAQLPYNPDANNDGQIGAYDLTSLLSVYSNSFSNGQLPNDVSMAEYLGDNFFYCSTGHCVADLYLLDDLSGSCQIQIQEFNGAKITAIVPEDFTGYLSVGDVNLQPFPQPFNGHGRVAQFLWWNGHTHVTW